MYAPLFIQREIDQNKLNKKMFDEAPEEIATVIYNFLYF